MEQNCLSAQSKNVYLKTKFKKIIITNTYLLFEKESKKLMKIFDSNNSSSFEIMWETGVEFGNSHVMWIAGDLKSTIGGPGAAPGINMFSTFIRPAGDCTPVSSLSGEGRLCSKRGYFFKASCI